MLYLNKLNYLNYIKNINSGKNTNNNKINQDIYNLKIDIPSGILAN